MAASTQPEFKLYYWPEIAGRGEFIRLLFAETQTPYVDVFEGKSFEEAKKMGYGKGKKHMAFPVLEHGDIYLSQTPVICRYLGKKLDGGRLYPKTEQDRLQAEIIMAGIVDWVEDGKKLRSYIFEFLIVFLSRKFRRHSCFLLQLLAYSSSISDENITIIILQVEQFTFHI